MGGTMWGTGGSTKNIMSEGYEDFTKDDCDELRAKILTTPIKSTHKQVYHESEFIFKETLADGTISNTAWPTHSSGAIKAIKLSASEMLTAPYTLGGKVMGSES
eukprot:7383945-Pyramimonas_sp.AAC.1